MSEVGFAEVRQRLFERYRARDHAGAMEIARSAAAAFPEHEDRTTYWIACLEALTGDADGALDVLTAGLARGLWWAPEMLRTDPDLAVLRDDGRLEAIIAASEDARRAWRGEMPTEPVVRELDADALRSVMVLLHGRNESPEEIVARWPTIPGIGLVAPRSSQPFAMHAGCWDDVAQAEADVERATQAALEALPARDMPLIVGGFSQGAGLSVLMAARHRIPGTVGVVAVAPSARWALEHLPSDPIDATSVRCALIVGNQDPVFDACGELARRLDESGAEVRTDVIAGLGHDYPPDLDRRVAPLVDWVLGARSGRA